MIHTDDIYYIDQVLAGDTQVYAVLVEKYQDMVFTLALGILHIREEAEEVSQDAFLKAYKSLTKYKRQAKFSTWLYRIVYNECISRLRKKKLDLVPFDNFKELSHGDPAAENEELWSLEEAQKIYLKKALADLDEIDRTIIMLYYYEDHSVDEIADITSLSAANVKIRLFRARKKLHLVLSKNFENVYL